MGSAIVCTGGLVASSPSVKFTVLVNCDLTALPSCMPGAHAGDALITRIASSAIACDGARMDLTSVKLPSVSTVNCSITLPCVFFCLSSAGYLIFIAKYLLNAGIPPGKLGNIWTTS